MYKQMNGFDSSLMPGPQRAGRKFRVNDSRLVHVKNRGWFVLVRGDTEHLEGICTQDGIVGPFPTERNARTYIKTILLAT